jgi:sugar phosphate isomerase/epimerase
MSDSGPELVLWAGCVIRHAILDRAAAVQAGGYSSMSLQTGDITSFLAQDGSLTELRRELEVREAPVLCVDPCLTWYPHYDGTEARGEAAAHLRASMDEVLHWTEGLGASLITALGPFHGVSAPSEEQVIDALGDFADRAGAVGARVQVEAIPTTRIATLEDALRLVRAVDRPNLGLVLDTYNMFRGGLDPEEIESVPHELIFQLQLADAETREAVGTDYFDDAYHHRALPGEGVLPMADVIERVARKGPLAPVGPEVFSDAMVSLPPEEAGHRSAEATRRFLASLDLD